MKYAWMKRLLAAALTLSMVLVLLPVAALAEPGVTEAYPQTLTLGVKETFQLTPDMVKDVDVKSVVFKSSNTRIVTVSKKGLITAKRQGTAKIGIGVGKTLLGVCTVTVKAAPKKIALSDKWLLMNVGNEGQLKFALPSGTASAVQFSSDDLSVAAVTSGGSVVATGRGKATITARTFNGKKAACNVYVLGGPSPKTLELTMTVFVVGVGDKFAVQPHIQLDEGADAFYAFSIANTKIATVSSSGILTGKKAGKTTLSVKTHNGLTATAKVEVMPAPKSISMDIKTRTMGIGGTYLLRVTQNPWASYCTITFTSSDESVATVDENGMIRVVAPGKCTITAKTHNGKKASCQITVLDVPEI